MKETAQVHLEILASADWHKDSPKVFIRDIIVAVKAFAEGSEFNFDYTVSSSTK